MKRSMKRYTALLLALILCFTLIPYGSVSAEDMVYADDAAVLSEESTQADDVTDDELLTEPTAEEGSAAEENDPSDTEEAGPSSDEDPSAEDPTEVEEPAEEDFSAEEEPAMEEETPAEEDAPEEDLSEELQEDELQEETDGVENADSDSEEDLFLVSELTEIASVTLPVKSYKYKGTKIKPEPEVKALNADGEEVVLQKDIDYTVKYKNNLNAGTATVTVTGIGDYTGTVKATFKIKPVKIGTVTLKYAKKTYTGKKITQTGTTVVTAKVNGKELVLTRGTDYTIRYENNVNVGMARLIVEGIGNYKGTVTEEFKIIPKKPELKSVTVGTKRFKAKWTAMGEQADGFQLQYSLAEDFSSDKTTILIEDGQAVSQTVEKVPAGKRYYVRMRAYKTAEEGTIYSRWSVTKSVKLRYNMIVVSGSGAKRTVYLHNPKKAVVDPEIAVWSQKHNQDDLKWYSMKKYSDGSWRATVPLAWMNNYGRCYVHVYNWNNGEYGDENFIGEKIFSITKSDLSKTKNTIGLDGSGIMTTLYLLHPKKDYKTVRAAVWSETNGQDDLDWVTLTKKADGNWSTDTNLTNILHSGRVQVHVYAGSATFLGAVTFKVKFGMEPCSSEEEYIKKIAPAVRRVCKKYGYLPSVLIAQSCLENGYGIPSYWDNPEISGLIYYNNMVGLKSELLSASWEDYTVWGGESVVKKTPEVYDGKAVIITDSFRVYDSIEQSFADYLLFMTYASNYGPGGKPKYGAAVTSITNPSELIKAVAKRGYATGSTYPTSVIRIIKKHDLTKYDDLSKVKPTTYGP